jgi:AcrR family transcriptional regulator
MSRERFFEDEHRIIDAAIDLICEIGYEKFSTRKLAARLGVSPMTLYNYFSNKEEIVHASVRVAYEKAFGAIKGELKEYFEQDSVCPLRSFLEMGRRLFAFSKQYPQMYSLVFVSSAPYSDPSPVIECYEYTSQKVLRRLVDKNREKELCQHLYLFQVLVSALVRTTYVGWGFSDQETFEENLLLAYEKLLKPFEQYFPTNMGRR